MWYTEIYFGIVAIALTLLAIENLNNQFFLIPIILFFLLATILGLLITQRVKKRIKSRLKIGLIIMKALKIDFYKVEESKNHIDDQNKKDRRRYTWMDYILYFYSIMCGVWLGLILFLLIYFVHNFSI